MAADRVTDEMLAVALAASMAYYESPDRVTDCKNCGGSGVKACDYCADCSGNGEVHDGTEEGAMRAALTAVAALRAEAGAVEFAADDPGPWEALIVADKVVVASEDFGHDVWLYVTGDFTSEAHSLAYANGIAKTLNDALAQARRTDTP